VALSDGLPSGPIGPTSPAALVGEDTAASTSAPFPGTGAASPSESSAPPRGLAIDLGSGAGVPGLILATLWPASHWVLLDGSQTRAAWLTDAVAELGLSDRVRVSADRAEVAGRGPLRGSAVLVVARAFGGPAVTAECGAPFLQQGGWLAVAEPPGGRPDRWSSAGLSSLGLATVRSVSDPFAFQVIQSVSACPDRFPRRTGVPAKRPLF
jgi:16S rRNA (guanine527-N7)-methyltransferase